MHPHHWIIEASFTPIYRRIAGALADALRQQGDRVDWVDRSKVEIPEYLGWIRRHPQAVLLTNGCSDRIRRKVVGGRQSWFESVPNPVAFIHHDAVLTEADPATALAMLRSYQQVADRSVHLCVEPQDARRLAAIGLPAQVISHATEFSPREPHDGPFDWTVGFVGHLIPSETSVGTPEDGATEFAKALFGLRRENPLAALQPAIDAAVETLVEPEAQGVEREAQVLATSQWLRARAHAFSLHLRGAWIEQADLPSLDVFGGDPSYLHGLPPKHLVQAPGVNNHPPVFEESQVQRIYRHTAVSLNFTALQFDEAVVNRVHDVFMAGGFCLTDRRSGLADLTRHHERIGFGSLDELRERCAYFSNPANLAERNAIVRDVQDDIERLEGYGAIARTLRQSLAM